MSLVVIANKVLLPLLLLLILVVGAAGCGGGKTVSGGSVSQASIESAQELGELNSKIVLQGANSSLSPADYLIGPADLLEIRVFESDKLTSTVRVSSRGKITLPLLANVNVDGLTARDAETKIESLLKEGGYINSPHVSVFLKEYKSKLVSVVGNVKAPGTYELLGRQTILDVLAAAKGLGPGAGTTAYLTRAEENGARQSYVLYLEDLLVDGDAAANLILKPGDVIYVPEAGSVFVEGAVTRPGSYPIKEGITTVSQTITMAGGPSAYAGSEVKLVRYLGNGQREIKELNLGAIREGKAEDLVIKDRDAVILTSSTVKKILTGLRLNYLYGLLGIGYDPPETVFYGN